MTSLTMARYFRKAADYLRPRGRWIRGQTIDGRGRVCARGALRVVSPIRYYLLEEHLERELISEILPDYNDKRSRRKGEIIHLFETAADALELRAQIKQLKRASRQSAKLLPGRAQPVPASPIPQKDSLPV